MCAVQVTKIPTPRIKAECLIFHFSAQLLEGFQGSYVGLHERHSVLQ